MEEPYLCCRVIYYSKQQDLITSKCDAETGNRILEMCSFIITNSVNTMNLLVYVEKAWLGVKSAAIPFIPHNTSPQSICSDDVLLLVTLVKGPRGSGCWCSSIIFIEHKDSRLTSKTGNQNQKSKGKNQGPKNRQDLSRRFKNTQGINAGKGLNDGTQSTMKNCQRKREHRLEDTSEGRLIGDRWTKSR